MMKHLLAFLLFFPALSALAQPVKLSASVASAAAPCDSSEKLFRIFRTGDDGDSLIWTKEDTACTLSADLDLTPGHYLIRISSGENVAEKAFDRAPGRSEIDLGTLTLKAKTADLEEFTITGVPKKFIVIDAEKTTVTVENNPVLEVSSVYDAILKIPGVIPYPGGGFALGGQQASVWFDGIPSSLSTNDMDNLLKSLPATSVQKIELITNPGASYDANQGGAIIDIITQGRASNWLSGTVTLNAGFNRNQKYMPSLLLSGKGRKYTWQIQTGYASMERNSRVLNERRYNYFDTVATLRSERTEHTVDQYTYFRPSFTWRFDRKSFLQVNAAVSGFRNGLDGSSATEVGDSAGTNLLADFERKGGGYQIEGGAKYRLLLDTLNRKIEIGVNGYHYDYLSRRLTDQTTSATTYTLLNNATLNDRFQARADAEIPLPKWKAQLNGGVKWIYYNVLSEGGYRFNDTVRPELETTDFAASLPFDYSEQNFAGYVEWKQRIGKKFSMTAGLRAEQFSLAGKVEETTLLERDYFNLFPSVHLLYRLIPDVANLMASYSRKVNMPGYSQFDPNVTGYYDNYTTSTGNTALAPNFLHRSQAKLTIFDYLQISVNHTLSNSINLSEVTADSNSYAINQTFRTYNNVQSWSSFFALPVPFGFFRHGLDFFNQAIDIDAISFVYLYAENDKTFIPGYNYVNGNRSLWSFGAYSQFILPWKIRMNVEYNFTAKGVIQLSETTKPVHDLEVIFSREFSDKKWRVSLTVQDVLNSVRNYSRISYAPLTISSDYKQDTRVVWIKVARSFGKYERPSLSEDAIPGRSEE